MGEKLPDDCDVDALDVGDVYETPAGTEFRVDQTFGPDGGLGRYEIPSDSYAVHVPVRDPDASECIEVPAATAHRDAVAVRGQATKGGGTEFDFNFVAPLRPGRPRATKIATSLAEANEDADMHLQPGDGGYDLRPSTVVGAVIQSAIETGGGLPVPQSIMMESEGYAEHGAFDVAVGESFFDELEDQDVLSHDRVEWEIVRTVDAADAADAVRAALDNAGYPGDASAVVDGLLSRDLSFGEANTIPFHYGPLLDEHICESYHDLNFVAAADYDGNLDPFADDADPADFSGDMFTERHITALDRFGKCVESIPPSAVDRGLEVVTVRINVEASNPYYG